MRRSLLAAAVLTVSMPAQAQWGGGDGAQAGATAYCAARAAGKDEAQASRAASNALVNSMSGSFASNIATIITGGNTMNDSLRYLIAKQCPEYIYQPGIPMSNETKEVKFPPEVCAKDPSLASWSACQNNSASSTTTTCSEGSSSKECQQKPSEQKPASNVAPTAASVKKSETTNKNAEKAAHGTCLKAVDYAGCMKYQLSK